MVTYPINHVLPNISNLGFYITRLKFKKPSSPLSRSEKSQDPIANHRIIIIKKYISEPLKELINVNRKELLNVVLLYLKQRLIKNTYLSKSLLERRDSLTIKV